MKLACVLSVHLLALCGAGAQTVLDLDSCLVLAAKNSPQLRIAGNALKIAELSRSELNTTALPQVQAILDAIYLPVPPRYGYDPAITDGGEVRGLLSVRQSVYDSGLRGLKADQSSVDLERLGHEQRLAGLDLAVAVKQVFYEALRAGEETALEGESVDQLDGYLGLVRRLFSGGSASQTDVLKTELQVSAARLALAKAREAWHVAKFALEELIGLPPDTSLSLKGAIEDTGGAAGDPGEIDPSGTIDMTVAGMLINRSMLEEDITRHERLPDISLFADAGYLSSGDNLRLPSSERINGLGYEVGIGIQLPILNWGATGLRTEQKEVATDDLRLRMELLRRSIASDTRMLHLKLAGARERLRVLQGDLAKARDNFILTKSRFAGGASLSLEVLSAQQTLTEAKLARLQALADIRTITAKIERLNAH